MVRISNFTMMMFPDFENVTKSDFFELQKRTLGSRKRAAEEDRSALKRFRSADPFSPKTSEDNSSTFF